jgi:mono/diheme cytochrome c family protein
MKKLLLMVVLISLAGTAMALPFNDDMVENQITDGQLSRAIPEGSIPMGSLNYKVKSKEDAQKLTNPVKADDFSLRRGKRLFQVNCQACHGVLDSGTQIPAPAGKFLGAPNISDPLYHSRTDGNIYGTIHFGGMAIMPALGWKLSPQETWDIINYVRSLQKSKE